MVFYIGKYKNMERREFDVEVVTPLFLGGAEPNRAELRVPSIKGTLRFWWRATHAHLPLDRLKEQESENFGDAGAKYGKSKVQIKITNSLLSDGSFKENPVPHKQVNFKFACFRPGEKFSIVIYGNQEVFDLFKLMSILGGLGKRSRRGFGSFRIDKVNGEEFEGILSTENILNYFNRICVDRFKIDKGKIIRTGNVNGNFAYIKCVEIGAKSFRTQKELLEKIGQSSHDNNSDYTGYAKGRERFSSPVCVSVMKFRSNEYKPVITTLNTAFKSDNQNHGRDKSLKFKTDILSGGSQ